MRNYSISAVLASFLLCAIHLGATQRYVSLTSASPTPPYTTWNTAAHVIQDAIDAAAPGDTVLVTNGLYNTGGYFVTNTMDGVTNRVAINKPLTVQSVNGPSVTTIQGSSIPGVTNLSIGVRCVFMTSNTTLAGFTLTFGAGAGGGGAFCENFTNSVLSNCVITANFASYGGGVAYGTLNDCVISSNSATVQGGGVYCSTLNHCSILGNYSGYIGGGGEGSSVYPAYQFWLNGCTIAGNSSATYGGGADGYRMYNCILTGNQSAQGGGAYGSWMVNCTVVSNSAPVGAGADFTVTLNSVVYYNNGPDIDDVGQGMLNTLYTCTPVIGYNSDGSFTNAPAFVNLGAGDFHLQSNSPCINSGNNSNLTILSDYSEDPFQLTYTSPITNDLDGNPRIIAGTVDVGAYEFQGNIRYVSLNSTNPVSPYSDWTIAATNIQDAIDAANPGDTVLVTNGDYRFGGHVETNTFDAVTNRVAITKPLTVESVNGPTVTIIEGYQVPGTTNGPTAVRGVYMTNNTTLIGFTVTHGATDGSDGGGVFCQNVTNSVLSNCVITANCAYYAGGGVSGGTLNDCVISSNSALYADSRGGGVEISAANHCLFVGNYAGFEGGAADGDSGEGVEFDQFEPALTNCTLIGNSASSGGGAQGETLINCLLVNNQAESGGGGAHSCFLYNCTVVSNSAPNGAGVAGSACLNCIVYYNNGPNIDQGTGGYSGPSYHTCTTPLPNVIYLGNFTNPPSFVNPAAGDLHLQSNSPCINAGNNAFPVYLDAFPLPANALLTLVTNDLDGNPRIVGGTVDAGAYEYQTPTSVISYQWLQQYGFPTDGSADYGDPDGDGMNNLQEWLAGTVPTNAASLLQMQIPALSNSIVTLTWQSEPTVTYYLQRSSNLSTFATIQSNILGQAGTTSCTDTNGSGNVSYFYRVGVQEGVQRFPGD